MRRKSFVFSVLLLCAITLSACIPSGFERPQVSVDGDSYLYPSMTYQYKTDVSASVGYFATGLDPAYLVLANKTHPLGSIYAPGELTTLTCPTYGGKSVTLEPRAAQALYAMLAEMAADGVTDIFVTSGYRTYAYQEQLFDSYLRRESATITEEARAYFGEDYIAKNYTSLGKTALSREDARAVVLSYSAEPGTSEHQTGLCVDFVTSTAMLDLTFQSTEAFAWLSKNAYRFGFILRYPADKTAVTGYSDEPWHDRFVGREAATEICLRNLTLEELLGQVG